MICLAQLASGWKFNLPAGTAWLSRPGSECSTGEDHDLSAGFPLSTYCKTKSLTLETIEEHLFTQLNSVSPTGPRLQPADQA